jgi:hypothetical protein
MPLSHVPETIEEMKRILAEHLKSLRSPKTQVLDGRWVPPPIKQAK